ncbi:RT0821/Lpp0805 family surface protein [Pseudemcibacter aquimaris]|uniref:RT0821/Lpp0805 family surface protein n=1 Tax=Pseudemcibacter aquimaris TaxID=2857064 RepID=UPI00237E2E57|nr:RT0821/Lpp0805 family surface protein [Pseudemcibacter aquimaris]
MTNFKSIAKITLMMLMSLSVMSCTKEESGTLLGAIGGAIIGSEITGDSSTGVMLGTLAGAYAGREIGRRLDEADQQQMYNTTQGALESGVSGEAQTWYNPDSGNRGTVTPQPAYQDTQGEYCREYQQTVTIGGEQETAYGTACRMPDGTWKIINS